MTDWPDGGTWTPVATWWTDRRGAPTGSFACCRVATSWGGGRPGYWVGHPSRTSAATHRPDARPRGARL